MKPFYKRAHENAAGQIPAGLGLGDLVHWITTGTGIAWAVGVVSRYRGKSCGCASRRARLNRWRIVFPIYRRTL